MKNSLSTKKLMLKSGMMTLVNKLSYGNHVGILRYHAIVEEHNNHYASPSICISPKIFESHVQYFTKYFNVVSLDTVWECLANDRPLPANAIAFTFDDGYRDNYKAFKILKEYGAHGTFYIASGCIGNKNYLWLSEVIYLLEKTKANFLALKVTGLCLTFSLNSQESRKDAIRKLTEIIKSNGLDVRELILSQLREQMSDVADIEDVLSKVMLTPEQIREMCDQGMLIGGHTETHLNLPNANVEDAAREIQQCKTVLEAITGRDVNHFSYPNGGNYDYYNDTIISLVQDAGYRTATTSNNGVAGLGSTLHELNRIRVTEEISEIVYQVQCEQFIGKAMGWQKWL